MTPTITAKFLGAIGSFFHRGLEDDAGPLVRELAALGFERLGICVEETSTGLVTPTVAFAHRERGVWASIFGSSLGPQLFLYTLFEDGSVVLTGGYEREPHRSPMAVLTGVPEARISEVLETHEREVAQMKQRSPPVRVDGSREQRIEATYRYYDNPEAAPGQYVPVRQRS